MESIYMMLVMMLIVLLTMMILMMSKKTCSTQAGAHFVIPTTVDLPPVIAEINRRMAMGIRP